MKRKQKDRQSSGDEHAPISLVLLLSQPRFLEPASLAKLAEKAWQRARVTVSGKSPTLTIQADERTFIVHNVDSPYFDEPQKAAAEMRELRLRRVIAQHEAWLSVEFVKSEKAETLPRVYQLIGQLIARLCDDDCLAVLCPATGGIAIYDDEVRHGLCEKDPMELLGNFTHSPVLSIAGDDPRMQKAVAEARRRWPEFVDAFENRSADQHFSVRAPFGDGRHTEFMWVGVTAIENDIIYGELGNEPLHVRGMNAGEIVQVRLADLSDWQFADGERMRGGFTIEALRQQADGER